MSSDKPVCGVDIVRDDRMDKSLRRCFHDDEWRQGKHASVFALKEAARKAVGAEQTGWLDIHVSYEEGRPSVSIRGYDGTICCSVSHEAGLTVAVVTGY